MEDSEADFVSTAKHFLKQNKLKKALVQKDGNYPPPKNI